jgi:hypothetical protein
MSVTAFDVEMAYRLFLDRTASEAEIANMAKSTESIASLRTSFILSEEFAAKERILKEANSAKRPPTVIYLHIPKTAGTTLGEALAAEPKLQPGAIVHSDLSVYRSLPLMQRRRLRLLRGHMNMGLGDLIDAPHRYICVIRRPGPRIYSFYRYVSRTKDHPHYKEVGESNLSFGEYLEFSQENLHHRVEIENGQVRRLSGQLLDPRVGVAHDYIRSALYNALRPNMTLGYAEHMDSLIQKLNAEGLLTNPVITSKNVAPTGTSYEEAVAALTDAQRKIFDAYTAWDNYFYDLCIALMPPN